VAVHRRNQARDEEGHCGLLCGRTASAGEAEDEIPTPNYRGLETVRHDRRRIGFPLVRAFPVLMDDSALDLQYRQNAERILLQSVAASTMSGTLPPLHWATTSGG